MTQHKSRWASVATAVNERMRQLGIDGQSDLMRRSGLSQPSAQAFMDGKPRGLSVRPQTQSKLCRGLQWKDGSLDLILQGRDPEPIEDAATSGAMTLDEFAERVESQLRELGAKIDDLAAVGLRVVSAVSPPDQLLDDEPQGTRASRPQP